MPNKKHSQTNSLEELVRTSLIVQLRLAGLPQRTI